MGGFFARPRVTLGKPAHQNAYQFKTPISLQAGATLSHEWGDRDVRAEMT